MPTSPRSLERRIRRPLYGLLAAGVAVTALAPPLIFSAVAAEGADERAETLAAIAAATLAGADDPAGAVRPVLADPDVVAVEILDGSGERVGAYPPGARVDPTLPTTQATAPVVGRRPDARRVRVVLSTAPIRAAVRRAWLFSTLAAAAVLLAGLLAIALLVRGGLAPLRALPTREDEPPAPAAMEGVERLVDIHRSRERALGRAAEASRSVVDAVMESAPVAIALFDAAGRCVRAGQRHLPGTPAPGAQQGRTLREIWSGLSEGEVDWAVESHATCLRENRMVEREVELPAPYGESRHLWTRWCPVERADDGGRGVLVMATDRTSRVRDREALEEGERRLRQAERLEMVGRLVGSVAHDFNNLLTVIGGYSDLVAASLEEEDPRTGDIQEVKLAAERATALAGRLLSFSRERAPEAAVLDPVESVERTRGMLKRILGEDIELELDAVGDHGRVLVDPVRLDQIILNLSVNARDAMPDGGALTVGVEEGGGRGPLPKAVVIYVSDTGTGMDEETASRIFDPFFTTKAEGKGTGLGLATVQEIVEEAGGFIEVDTELGRGTTFRVHLPRVEPDADEEAARRRKGKFTTPRHERILVVDDEVPIRRLMRRVLESRGYRVTEARNAAHALELARGAEAPDLVVTDVAMPGMTGTELAARLWELNPTLDVLYVSAHHDEYLMDQGLEGTGRDLLRKPFSPEALAWRVREILDA